VPKIRSVRFRPSAVDDIVAIYAYIAEQTGHSRAEAYVSRIEDFCRSLGSFPERGRRRDDLGEGLRTIPFERRAIIAYRVAADHVLIVRTIHGGKYYDEDSFQ
jgi:toxin ParE1/3/4